MNFTDIAASAFPPACASAAATAAAQLGGAVDTDYEIRTVPFIIDGQTIYIPQRIHFLTDLEELLSCDTNNTFMFCLVSRSTNGFIRQKALQNILKKSEPWIAPYVVSLAADYVIEIADDIRHALPIFNPAIYRNFVLENRTAMRTIKSRATSYWNEYYRFQYPNTADYPGLIVVKQIEIWAS